MQLSLKFAARILTRSFGIGVLAVAGLLCAPVAAHAGRITLTWNASTSAVSGYHVLWGTSPGVYSTSLDVGNQTTYAVDGLTNGVTYYFAVRAYTAAGVVSLNSNEVSGFPSGVPFTDPQLSSSVSPIKAIHISEMRTRIDALRVTSGLGGFAWDDSTLAAGSTVIKSVHITQMRMALEQVYKVRGLPPPSYADSVLSATSTLIKAAHISELRAAIQAIE